MFSEGELTLHIGPMFSGKSTTLIRTLGTYADLGVKALYINSNIDTRNQEQIVSNRSSNYSHISSKVDVVSVQYLGSVDVADYRVIGVDEGQFFSDLLLVVDWVEGASKGESKPKATNDQATSDRTAVDGENKIVEVAGLDGSFKRQQMGSMLSLIPFCDKVHKHRAVCKKCLENDQYREAPFTARRSKSSDKEILVGGAEHYLPLCRSCFLQM